MPTCFFASDLHGQVPRYRSLLQRIADDRPDAVFLGGDLLPHGLAPDHAAAHGNGDFLTDFLLAELARLRKTLGEAYPRIFVILGNDDARTAEAPFLAAADAGLWEYLHQRHTTFAGYDVYGYACVPPTPFLLKDWERYDVSRFVDPGCVSPEEGYRSVSVPTHEIRYGTIQEDLEQLLAGRSLDRAILLFHTPPYKTRLDRAGLDGKIVDHVQVDVHVGSVAVQRLITERQPLITLHGHIHESARLTGAWSQRLGRTHCFSAAHDGPDLALVQFDPADPGAARRLLC